MLVRFGSIPKTSSGKIQRHACRDNFQGETLKAIASWFAWEDHEQITIPAPKARHAATKSKQEFEPALLELVIAKIRDVARERAPAPPLASFLFLICPVVAFRIL